MQNPAEKILIFSGISDIIYFFVSEGLQLNTNETFLGRANGKPNIAVPTVYALSACVVG